MEMELSEKHMHWEHVEAPCKQWKVSSTLQTIQLAALSSMSRPPLQESAGPTLASPATTDPTEQGVEVSHPCSQGTG